MIGELAAQETGTAWLVLLTITHPGLPTPIRVTSDGVVTVHNGNTFDPFPFEVTLPDDVEGRAPQAHLRIDNTSQEIIALLRGLVTPPSLTNGLWWRPGSRRRRRTGQLSPPGGSSGPRR